MNRLMKNFPIVIALLFSSNLNSQTITGKITGKTEVLPFANVILKDTNNKFIEGTTTSFEGFFELKTEAKAYVLEVSYLGYTTWIKEIAVEGNIYLGNVVLEKNAQAIEEVIIFAEKIALERKIDRLVFNVEKSIAATGGNGVDVLRVTPGVQLQNDVLSILGKGSTQVMINGRLSPLEGEELISFLSGFSANDIVKVEVITNPPAKYDASGNGGLINIVLKKGIQNSWKNSTVFSYNQNKYNFSTINNNFLYNKNKISISAGLNATKGFIENLESLQISYPDNLWDINIQGKIKKDLLSGRFLMDYDLSDKTTLGIQYLGSSSQPTIDATAGSSIFDEDNNLEKNLLNSALNEVDNQNHSLNFHFNTQLDTLGKSISYDADYFTYNADKMLNFFTEQFNNNEISEGINSSALNISNQNITNISSKLDIDLPYKKVNLSFGIKTSITNTASGILFYNTLSGNPILDPNQSNDFEYRENVLATYFSGNTKLSEKLKMQFGLRFEDTRTRGFNVNLDEENKNEYRKFFPSLHLSHLKNDNNSFGFSYGKRINRPNFNNLNPFRFYINDNSYSVGNPFLQPSFSDNFEISHLYKNNLNTSLSLSVTTNGYGVFFNTDLTNQDQIITRENYFTKYTYSLGESFTYNKVSWWQSQNSVNLLIHITELTKDFNAEINNGVQFYMQSNNLFSLSKKTKLQANAWYSSYHNDGLFSVGEMLHLSLGLQHNFENSLKLSVLFSDILNTGSLRNYNSTVNGIEQSYSQNRSSRNIRISLSYDFGNKKVKVKNRRFGNDAEQRRSN